MVFGVTLVANKLPAQTIYYLKRGGGPIAPASFFLKEKPEWQIQDDIT
jgi:hypothetical protein